MVISLVGGLIVGLGFLFLREHLIRSNQGAVWQTINQILSKIFQILKRTICDWAFLYYWSTIYQRPTISDCADGLYFITLAICHITDTQKLGRISYKTIFGFIDVTDCSINGWNCGL